MQIVRCIAIVKEVTKVFRSLPAIMVWSLQHLLVQMGLLVCGLFIVMWTLDDEVWAKVTADTLTLSLTLTLTLTLTLSLTLWAKVTADHSPPA